MTEYNFGEVRYWGDVFKDCKPFELYEYKKLKTMYDGHYSTLDGYEKAGWNTESINSDEEELDDSKFWFGYEPVYHWVGAKDNVRPTKAKSDLASMDIRGYGKYWTHFVYLTLPYEFINEYMTHLHDNDDTSKIKEYIDYVENTDEKWEGEYYKQVMKDFDRKYPETSEYEDYFEKHTCVKWRQDFEVEHYISMRNDGLLYPICYNSFTDILRRGTHRAALLAKSKSDVPIFFQYPGLDIGTVDCIELKTPDFFSEGSLTIKVFMKEKRMELLFGKKLIGYTEL